MQRTHHSPSFFALAACNLVLFLGLASSAYAQTAPAMQPLFTFVCTVSVVHFQQVLTCPQGQQPNTLLQSADGNFYGTTISGGTGNHPAGTVFKITPAGHLTTLHTFVADQNGNYPNGAFPTSLLEGDDGFLYGAAGVVFRLSKTGTFSVVPNTPGSATTLTLGRDGNFYGGTFGTNTAGGTLFRLTPRGSYTLLHVLNPTVEGPMAIGMTQASDGNFYGTTVGGEELLTTLFRLTPGGQFGTLQIMHYSLFPTSAPIQASNGNLCFGMTGNWLAESDLSANAVLNSVIAIQVPHFPVPGSGFHIIQQLTQASDSNLWAVVNDEPAGEIVSFSQSGTAKQTIPVDQTIGQLPDAPLVQGSNGKFFGVTLQGGAVPQGDAGGGTVFTLNAGLPAPKAAIAGFNVSSGTVGASILIQGSHFIGTTAVTFNGVAASFKVLNTGNIRATVPAGATTGPVEVTNPGGTSTSTATFKVD